MAARQWSEYVRRVTVNMTQTEAAERAGVTQTAIGRWIRGDTDAPRAESVVAFARALDINPLEALVAAGYLLPSEVGQSVNLRTPISDFSDIEIIDELKRRATGSTGR